MRVFISLLLLPAILLADSNVPLEQFTQWLYKSPHPTGPLNPLDEDWESWLQRTGERPPVFSPETANQTVDDDLIEYIQSDDRADLESQWIAQLEYWMIGKAPPAPATVVAETLGTEQEGDVRVETILLKFGPDQAARLHLRLYLPPADGPHPVLLTQWNHESWARMAVRRGYAACLYAAADARDDTVNYPEIWFPEYDFSKLHQRAWAGSRAVDYLFTREDIRKDQIALGGHSRNGQQSLIFAAMDDRIAATVLSSGGTSLFRHAAHRFGIQPLDKLTGWFPHWYHPRLRFFTGRENHLPVDRHHLMALIAPRGLLFSVAHHELSNPWGVDRLYQVLSPLYEESGHPDRLGIVYRDGRHRTAGPDLEDYLDFFDAVFQRPGGAVPRSFPYHWNYDQWLAGGGKPFSTLQGSSDQEADQDDPADRRSILQRSLGSSPPHHVDTKSFNFADLAAKRQLDDFKSWILNRPWETDTMGKKQFAGTSNHLSPHNYGYLYYPKALLDDPESGLPKLPAIVFLHGPEFAQGYGRTSQFLLEGLTQSGYVVLAYDQLGFGSRYAEGEAFYKRYPGWSRLGAMIADVNAAVDRLQRLDAVDPSRVYVCGYDIGGGVGLLATALNANIAGAASLNGFTPWRTSAEAGVPGLREWTHEFGLWPQLGEYVGNESELPLDWDDVLRAIGERPVFVATGKYSQDSDYGALEDMAASLQTGTKPAPRLKFSFLEDFNRLSSSVYGALGEAELIRYFSGLNQ